MRGEKWCYVHHPDHRERRRRAGRKGGKRGGRGRPLVEVHGLRGQLEDLYTSVLTGMLGPKIGTTAAQIAHARIRLIETERRLRETEDLERRLEELETLLEDKERSAWG